MHRITLPQAQLWNEDCNSRLGNVDTKIEYGFFWMLDILFSNVDIKS